MQIHNHDYARTMRNVVTTLSITACLLAPALSAEAAPPPEKAELVFGGGAGYFLQDVDGIPGDDTPELTWTVGLDLRVKRLGAAYDLTVEPSYVYQDPRSPFDPIPRVTAYHHDFYLRWFFLVRPPAAFSVAGCLDVTGVYTPPLQFTYEGRVYGSFQPGIYLGCELRPVAWLRASLQTGFTRRVKPSRRTRYYPEQTRYVLSNTWASHLNASYWLWDFLGVGVRTSVYVDGPGEPKDDEKYAGIDYPPAVCWAVFVGPTVNFTAFGSYF